VSAVLSAILLALGVLAAVLGLLALATWPVVKAVQERQRVEAELRLSAYQLHHLTHQAMARLLEEARRGQSRP